MGNNSCVEADVVDVLGAGMLGLGRSLAVVARVKLITAHIIRNWPGGGWGAERDKVKERRKEGEKRGREEAFEGQSKKAGCMRIAWGKEEIDTSGNHADHGNQKSTSSQSQASSPRSERVQLYQGPAFVYRETYFLRRLIVSRK